MNNDVKYYLIILIIYLLIETFLINVEFPKDTRNLFIDWVSKGPAI
jgi:hypothetical protein